MLCYLINNFINNEKNTVHNQILMKHKTENLIFC